MAAGATYEPIATQTLASAATSITFSSIAASWTDLRLVFVGTGVASGNLLARVNGDSATNYSQTYLQGYGSGTNSGSGTSLTSFIITLAGSGLSTTIPQLYTIDFFSYAGSTNKTILTTSSEDQNGSGTVVRTVQLWRSTAAITSIVLSNSGGNLAIGTTATLYGILKA